MGMVGLALLLLVREQGGSYAAAGAVSGAYFVATAIGAPIAGRLVDRRGQARILLRRAVIFPALLGGVCALALLDAPLALIGACAAAAGALMPPVGSSLRALWPRLFSDGELRAAAYALEASLQEITFIAGPLLVALLTAAASPALALGVAAAVGGIGTMLIALAEPVRAWRPDEERHASILGALASRGVVTIVSLSACLGLGFGGTEVGFPAFAEGHGGAELGSIPLSLFAAGSLVGGLVAGARVTMTPIAAASRLDRAARARPRAAAARLVAAEHGGARVPRRPADRARRHVRVRPRSTPSPSPGPRPRRSPGSRRRSSPASRSGWRSVER